MDDTKEKIKRWSDWEKQYLKKKYRADRITQIAEELGRTRQAVMAMASKMGLKSGRYFTQQELRYMNQYISQSNDFFCKKFKRKNESIRKIRYRLFESVIDSNFERLTCAEVGRIVGKDKSTIAKCWCKDIPYQFIGKYKMILVDDLMEFLKNNPTRWDATKCEKWFFEDCDWFWQKREQDFANMVDRRWNVS